MSSLRFEIIITYSWISQRRLASNEQPKAICYRDGGASVEPELLFEGVETSSSFFGQPQQVVCVNTRCLYWTSAGTGT